MGQAETFAAGLRLQDGVTPFLALLANRPAHQFLVVHYQHFLMRHKVSSRCRQGQRKDRTLIALAFYRDLPAVQLHNTSRQRQSQSRARSLGGEERPENIGKILGSDATSIVRYF